MRPLLEILEDERVLLQKYESVYRYLSKTDDNDVIDILLAQKSKTEKDLIGVHEELRVYLSVLFKQS